MLTYYVPFPDTVATHLPPCQHCCCAGTDGESSL